MNGTIPIEYVEGVEETTVWLWPDTPDPVTVRFEREEWEEIQQAADGESVEEYIGRVVLEDLEN